MPQYSGVWSLQQQMQALTSGQWATDPLFDYTTLLLQGDAGANGAQNNVFYDTSPNQFAITRNGNTTQGTFSPFSATGWGNYFDGSGDYISMPSATSALALGSGDWTIECFVNVDNLSSERTILDILDGNSANRIIWRIKTSGLLAFQGSNGADRSVTTTTVPTSTWVHLAICKASGTTRMFINGVQANSNYTDSNTYANSGASTIGIIASDLSSAPFLGYISNFRVVKGTALYTANFTPSPTALTAVTNTSLLTCQSNRFIDNSTNALSLTIGGNTSVQPFSPFAPQYQWTSDVIGGSGYFDGTGDYLSGVSGGMPSGQGTAFTLQTWVYVTSLAAARVITRGDSPGRLEIRIDTNGSVSVDNVSTAAICATAAGAVRVNEWTHIAVTRTTGNIYTIYVNGVSSATSSAYTTSMTANNTIGYSLFSGSNYFVGYMSGFRVTTTLETISVPTAPLTAITGTSLLLNFTNAGIIDGTMKNNLETVGNAQVSTSVVKYGSGSLSFAGATTDALWLASRPYFATGTSDFTVEAWVRVNSLAAVSTVCGTRTAVNTTTGWNVAVLTDGSAQIYDNTGYANTGASSIAINTWYHIAFVRINNVIYSYVNGIQKASTACTRDWTQSTFWVGNTGGSSEPMNGYIDDLRVSRFARYTQNFTPPSVALPRQ